MPTPPRPTARRGGSNGRRGRSTAGRSGRASASRSGGSPSNLPLIGGIAAAIVVVVIVAVGFGGGGTEAGTGTNQPTETGGSAETRSQSAAPAAAPSVDLSGGRERAGEPPERPAPTITDDDLSAAEQHYQRAKQLWNDGQRARTAGDTKTYTSAMDEAFAAMEEQRETLRKYTDWYEEADLGEWRMPGDYVALERKLTEYDRLFQRIKKVKQIR